VPEGLRVAQRHPAHARLERAQQAVVHLTRRGDRLLTCSSPFPISASFGAFSEHSNLGLSENRCFWLLASHTG
jgi:hypothetical protein